MADPNRSRYRKQMPSPTAGYADAVASAPVYRSGRKARLSFTDPSACARTDRSRTSPASTAWARRRPAPRPRLHGRAVWRAGLQLAPRHRLEIFPARRASARATSRAIAEVVPAPARVLPTAGNRCHWRLPRPPTRSAPWLADTGEVPRAGHGSPSCDGTDGCTAASRGRYVIK